MPRSRQSSTIHMPKPHPSGCRFPKPSFQKMPTAWRALSTPKLFLSSIRPRHKQRELPLLQSQEAALEDESPSSNSEAKDLVRGRSQSTKGNWLWIQTEDRQNRDARAAE